MSSDELKKLVHSSLPQDILPGPNLNPTQSADYVKNFLIQSLPSSDIKDIKDGLQWKFMLMKHSLKKKELLKRKKTFLTRKQRLENNLLKLPKEEWDYASFEPLRTMWREYMRQNLETIKAPSCIDSDWNAFSTIVAKSELIGSEMTIVKSKVPSQVGMSGTVVLETKMTFQILTPQSKLKIILKPTSVFQFQLDNMRFTVFGKHIATRPHERSVKKIKSQMVPEL